MLVIQSKVIDIRDRKQRKTWDKLPRRVQGEFVSNPARVENTESSWALGETNSEYRR